MSEGLGRACAVILGEFCVEEGEIVLMKLVRFQAVRSRRLVLTVVLQLLPKVVAVLVIACAESGTAGDARDIDVWRSRTASSDREDSILALVTQMLTR